MKNLLPALFLLLIITSSCKTNSNCDAYSKNLNIEIDSLKLQVKNKKDSIDLLNTYIIFLENETQFLSSILAEKELEDGIE